MTPPNRGKTTPRKRGKLNDGLGAATLDAIAAVGPLPARPVVHLDAGYDCRPCRQALTERGMVGQIATRGLPAPVQAGRRWVIERTHAWGNQYGKLRWCTERRRLVVEFWLALANAVIVLGRLSAAPGPLLLGRIAHIDAHHHSWRSLLQAQRWTGSDADLAIPVAPGITAPSTRPQQGCRQWPSSPWPCSPSGCCWWPACPPASSSAAPVRQAPPHFRDRPGSPQWWARLLSAVGFACAVAAPLAELAGLEPIAILDRSPVRAAGVVLAVLGIAATLAAQLAMGASWRPDVDRDARTALVTGRPFRLIRNPIFTVTAAATGLALIVPNVVAAAMLVAFVAALQLQVRLVEEPYLHRIHGTAWDRYAAQTGRFLPWIGRHRPGAGRRRNLMIADRSEISVELPHPHASADRREPTYWRRP